MRRKIPTKPEDPDNVKPFADIKPAALGRQMSEMLHTFSGNATMSWSTYTISYNANGGTGAPSSQTKTYDVPLILSKTIPKRACVKKQEKTV